MKFQPALLLLILLLGPTVPLYRAPDKSHTSSETRELLLRMERRQGNHELRRLFEEADTRMPDLLAALDDSEKQVSINAQVIIKYLAEPNGLHALDEWYKAQQKSGKDYWMPKMELLTDPKYLKGDDSDLSELALQNKDLFEASRFNAGDVSVKVIAYNKNSKAALLEVVQGQILTAGWHSVIKQENNRWRLVSDNNVWVT